MIYKALCIFFIFSFFGWALETVFDLIVRKRFVNRGFLNGPICPIYGVAVLLMSFLMRPAMKNFALLMVGALIICSLLELVTGMLLEKIFRQKWWDYSDKPHNFRGYICLKFCALWAVLGAFSTRMLVPRIWSLVELIPRQAGNFILLILLALLIADIIVSLFGIITFNMRLRSLEYVTKKLEGAPKEMQAKVMGGDSAEIETGAEPKPWLKEAEALKKKYEHAIKHNILHARLLKAFPDLVSPRYNRQIEELRVKFNIFARKSEGIMKKRDSDAAAVYEEKVPEGQEPPFAYAFSFPKIFWVFIICSFIGFVLETLYCLISPPHEFEWRVSLVYGPFIAVYGLGALLFTLFLHNMYNQKDLLIFIASMAIGAAFEYISSFAQQIAFGTVSWEYSDSPLNVGGRTNLMYAFFWGILGLVWVKDLYPKISRFIEKWPRKAGNRVTAVAFVLLMIDVAMSCGAIYRNSERVNGIEATNSVQEYFDKHFPDERMKIIYPGMQYVGKPQRPEKSEAVKR